MVLPGKIKSAVVKKTTNPPLLFMKTRIIIYLSLLCCTGIKAQKQWTLSDCINYAIEHNLEIQKQEVTQKQQEIELNTAKFSRLPNLNGNASQSFDFGRALNSQNIYTDRNTKNTSFNVSTDISLFTGMQIPNTIALNKLNLKASIEDLNKAKEDIGIQVTSSFLQVLFNEELYKVAQEQVRLSKEQYERIKRLNEVGKAAVSEVYEAKSRVAQDELSMTQTYNNWKLALLDLSQLLELPSPEGFEIISPEEQPDFQTLSSPDDLFNIAVLSKPGILATQYRLQGMGKSIRIAQSAYYPKLSFGAGISTAYYNLKGVDNEPFGKQLGNNFSKYVGFTLSVPIFNRLETRNRVRTARLNRTMQSLALEDSKKTLYKEIQQAYYNAVAAQSKYNSCETAMAASDASFRLMKEKYDNSKATAVEYNEIKTNLMKATSDKIQAKYEYIFRKKILDFYKGIPLNQ